jgi:hypothetical protein
VFDELPGDHSWVYDLIAPDDDVRHRALNRHRELLATAWEARHWQNRIWARAGTPVSAKPHLAAEMDQARAEYDWHRQQTIFGPIDAFWDAGPADQQARRRYAPYAVLYLQWEATHPLEWRAPGSHMWSPWSRKEVLLNRLHRNGVPEPIRPQIGDLIVAAVQRPYRCKDWMYGRLVRHVLDPPFVDAVEAVLTTGDPLIRLRAQFILHLARNPDRSVNRMSWRRWLASDEEN